MRKFCFALALMFLLPAHAQAWDGVQTVAKSGTGDLVVAGNEHGRRAVVWSHGRGVFVRVAPRGGRFGPRLRLAASGSYARAAMDERGDTAIVWNQFVDEDPDYPPQGETDDGEAFCCVRLIAVVLRRDGRVTPPVDLGVPNAINGVAHLSSDGNGRLALAWGTLDENSRAIGVHARFGTMRRGLGRIRLMSPADEYIGGIVNAARGRVVYTTSHQTVETSLRPGGRLARRVLVPFAVHQLAADDQNRQTGAWETGETVTRTPPDGFETVAQREAGRDPRLSVAGSGAAVVAWTPGESASTPPTGLKAFVRPPDGEFAAALELDPLAAAYEITVDSVDASPDGGAAVGATFWHHDEPDPILQSRIYLVPRGGEGFERLTFPRSAGAGVRVLRDARGTLAVMRTTAGGYVARWVR